MRQEQHQNRAGGFSLIELLIVIGVLVLVAGLSIPFYQSFQVSSNLDNTTGEVTSALRRVQGMAMGSQQWSPWGIHLESRRYILFAGAAYAAGDPTNEVFTIPQNITISTTTGTDIIFSRVKGETSNTGTVTLRSSNNESSTLTINSQGIINVQ
ncbi:MAG: GspH/FimT family pseudopilin [Patescibacteria group bacterium]|jgi:type II secretory pathway pseudopilin PulG